MGSGASMALEEAGEAAQGDTNTPLTLQPLLHRAAKKRLADLVGVAGVAATEVGAGLGGQETEYYEVQLESTEDYEGVLAAVTAALEEEEEGEEGGGVVTGLAGLKVVAECGDSSKLGGLRALMEAGSGLRGVGGGVYGGVNARVKELCLASNQLTDEAVLDCTYLQTQSAAQRMSLGGNAFVNAFRLCHCLPPSLLHLDLSYSDKLHLQCGSFVALPQLRTLVLDGCGMATTMDASADWMQSEDLDPEIGKPLLSEYLQRHGQGSVFAGLVSLTSLSLRDNALHDVEACRGLSFFARCGGGGGGGGGVGSAGDGDGDDDDDDDDDDGGCGGGVGGGLDVGVGVLARVDIEENDVCESKAQLDMLVDAFASWGVTSLQAVGRRLVGEGRAKADAARAGMTAVVLVRGPRGGSGAGMGPTDANGNDAMEAEFLASLRGEHDNAVVG